MRVGNNQSEILPLFCVRATEKRTGQHFYINFQSSDAIQEPRVEFDEETIVKVLTYHSRTVEQYKVPMNLSQIYWSKSEDNDEASRAYVVDVEINSRFAIRRVIPSEVIRHFVVSIAMSSLESKFNHANASKSVRQYVGHKIDFDPSDYEILKNKQHQERSNELVNNKILLVEKPSSSEEVREIVPSGDRLELSDSTETSVDLFLRPKSMLLTCSIHTDTCPDSFSFNDDRVLVELGDEVLLDVHLPLNIDLDERAKFKFDDRQGLFRIVFKLKE